MPTANRNFGDQPKIRGIGTTLHGYNPGGDDPAILRQVDGHEPYATGAEGSNAHSSGAGSPGWDDPIGVQVEDD